ncbi:MAG: 2-oxoglutarate dehydrogenase, E2 component, dihydrolipoamide succinyltransferase [Streptosporangiaceae bacterium]
MSVSVSMPQLGESVTEGTVTRWLKHEGDHVSADEPLLEVSTDKVDTEIPSPVSGILRGITVAEDETVAVGAELAIIDEDGSPGAAPGAQESAPAGQEAAQQAPPSDAEPQPAEPQYEQAQYEQAQYQQSEYGQAQYEQAPYEQAQYEQAPYEQAQYEQTQYQQGPYAQPATGYEAPPSYPEQGQQPGQAYAGQPASYQVPPPAPEAAPPAPAPAGPYQAARAEPAQPASYAAPPAPAQPETGQPPPAEEPAAAEGVESPYVTPLVRKLAAEHDVDLASIVGTGVGGRIRKQDVLDAARQRRGGEAPRPAAAPAGPGPAAQPAVATRPVPAAQPAATPSAQAAPAPKTIPAPSSMRGTTERLSRARQVIAQRMVESLQTSAQLTTVVEADDTAIARLRDRIKSAFEDREGVKLSFLPFFALATVEALKAHPKLNAVLDTANGTVTYHDAEHLGIAVDTERGLMVPVIRNAGDLNIGGLARKIADLAQRTRAGQVSPDDLTGGTFTLTNTGSRGALFDTPIINQPQVGILGTGTVSKRAVVVDDPDLGEVITVRSILYLALTYDHRLVDGADAARFLVTIKNRLEEGSFEAEFGR